MSEARFEENAESCDRLAAIMFAPAQRDAYIEMAKMWRKLAKETGNHLQRVAAWERRNGCKSADSLHAPFPHGVDVKSPADAG